MTITLFQHTLSINHQNLLQQQGQFQFITSTQFICSYELLHDIIIQNCQKMDLRQYFFRICPSTQITPELQKYSNEYQEIQFLKNSDDLQKYLVTNSDDVLKLAVVLYTQNSKQLIHLISTTELVYFQQTIQTTDNEEQQESDIDQDMLLDHNDEPAEQKYVKIPIRNEKVKLFCDFVAFCIKNADNKEVIEQKLKYLEK